MLLIDEETHYTPEEKAIDNVDPGNLGVDVVEGRGSWHLGRLVDGESILQRDPRHRLGQCFVGIQSC